MKDCSKICFIGGGADYVELLLLSIFFKKVPLIILLLLSEGNLRRCLTQQADVRVQLYEVISIEAHK